MQRHAKADKVMLKEMSFYSNTLLEKDKWLIR